MTCDITPRKKGDQGRSKKTEEDQNKEKKDLNIKRQKNIEKNIFYRFKPTIQLHYRNGVARL